MIPVQTLTLEQDIGNGCEDNKAYALLDNLELNQRERSSIALEAYAVGRHLTTILEKGDAP